MAFCSSSLISLRWLWKSHRKKTHLSSRSHLMVSRHLMTAHRAWSRSYRPERTRTVGWMAARGLWSPSKRTSNLESRVENRTGTNNRGMQGRTGLELIKEMEYKGRTNWRKRPRERARSRKTVMIKQLMLGNRWDLHRKRSHFAVVLFQMYKLLLISSLIFCKVKTPIEMRKTPVSEARKTPVTQTQTTCSSQFIPIHHPGAFPPLPSRPGALRHFLICHTWTLLTRAV